MVTVLIEKFSKEIERLKLENGQLKHSRDSVTDFYKTEFNNLWQRYKVLSGEDEQEMIKESGTVSEAQETKEELRIMFEELKIWVQTTRTEELKLMEERLANSQEHLVKRTEVVKKVTKKGSYQDTEESTLERNDSNFSFNYKT